MRGIAFGGEVTAVIAIGQVATGVVAIGQMATGVIAGPGLVWGALGPLRHDLTRVGGVFRSPPHVLR